MHISELKETKEWKERDENKCRIIQDVNKSFQMHLRKSKEAINFWKIKCSAKHLPCGYLKLSEKFTCEVRRYQTFLCNRGREKAQYFVEKKNAMKL